MMIDLHELKTNSNFMAKDSEGNLIWCEVIKLSKDRFHALVINGYWTISFDRETGMSTTSGIPLYEICSTDQLSYSHKDYTSALADYRNNTI